MSNNNYSNSLLVIAVSTAVVTAVLVSLISVTVTSIVSYLLYWKKNKIQTQNKTSATDHVIYDLPTIINNDQNNNIDTEMMEQNLAYGVVKK